MKAGMIRAILIGMALSFSVQAQDKKEEKKAPSAAQKAQQERMADCNKQASAKGMKGDARKDFMSGCLKDKPQDRMAKCNKEATGKKGDERKKFMSECLKA
jgi:hypothetical protein